MEKINKEDFKKTYKAVCEKYVAFFCEKQQLSFDGWVGDNIGGIVECGDFYFNFQDIVWDINSDQKKGLIIDWYNFVLDNRIKSVNYYSFTQGYRLSD